MRQEWYKSDGGDFEESDIELGAFLQELKQVSARRLVQYRSKQLM